MATTTAASGHEPRRPALDVEELLGTHVGPEPGLGAHDVVGDQREAVGDDRVVAVRDVGERAGVDERGPTFERLQQVRLERVAQQDGHRAGDADVLGRDRLAVHRRRQDDPAEAGAQVLEVGREREDGHDLGADA